MIAATVVATTGRFIAGVLLLWSDIQVVGVDREGFDFQRTTPTAISPMEPTAPLVDAEKITRGYYDQTVLVTCHVTSLIPFTVQWYRNAVELGNRLFYR